MSTTRVLCYLKFKPTNHYDVYFKKDALLGKKWYQPQSPTAIRASISIHTLYHTKYYYSQVTG